MAKNWRLISSFLGLVFIIFLLTKYSKITSQREVLLQKLFNINQQVDESWLWQNEKWSFYYDAKSLMQKKSVWYVLRSEDPEGASTEARYSVVNLKNGEVFLKHLALFKLDKNEKPKFEIKKISQNTEALFFVEKSCQKDFCSEMLKVFSLEPETVLEIGNIPLSASNLLTCKKENKPCFEYYGTYLLEKSNRGSSEQNIKITFKGFEEDSSGKAKPVESENYIFENGKYFSESFKKFH